MENQTAQNLEGTPIHVVAQVSRIVSEAADRVIGDRFDMPLLVSLAVVRTLSRFNIKSQVMYGPAAWVEVMLDHSVIWSGCWGQSHGFWVATQFSETVDLNTSVSHRKKGTIGPSAGAQTLSSPPMIWSREVPKFYKYEPVGVADVLREDLRDERDLQMYDRLMKAVDEAVIRLEGEVTADDFPNEPLVCPDRRILDDSKNSFKQYDRALGVKGIPQSPF